MNNTENNRESTNRKNTKEKSTNPDKNPQPKSILCFGDSNTWGLIAGTKERYPWGVRWTSLLQEKLPFPEFRVIEEGLCGRTSIFEDPWRKGIAGDQVLPILLESQKPLSQIVLMLGTNDCKKNYQATVEEICAGIQKLLDQIRSIVPSCPVLLLSPIELGDRVWEEGFDPEFEEWSVQKSRELPAAYAALARRSGVDFLAASDYAVPSEVDREHMDAEGHRRLAEAIYRKILPNLGSSDAASSAITGEETSSREEGQHSPAAFRCSSASPIRRSA